MRRTICVAALNGWTRVGALVTIAVVFAGAGTERAAAQAAPYTTYYQYDMGRRLVGEIHADPDGSGPIKFAAIRYTYDPQGMLKFVEKGELTSFVSDWTGFTVFQTQEATYDDDGRKIEAHLATGSASPGGTIYSLTQTSYDSVGRVDCTVTRMNPATFGAAQPGACALGTAGSFGPDRVTKTTYDTTTHVLKVQRAFGTSLQQDYATYTYTNNQQKTATDANGNLTSYAYDDFARLSDQIFPSPTVVGQPNNNDYEHYTYDNNGNRLSLRKRDTSVISYQYDALNRVTFKDIPGGTVNDVYYEYDLRGLQTAAMFGLTSGSGESATGITTTYDGFGRVVSTTNNSDSVSRTLSYQYDSDGDRTRITHPDSGGTAYFTYHYDGLDRVDYICEAVSPCTSTSSPVIGITYDSQGNRWKLTRGGGVASTTALYDPIARLQSLSLDLLATQYDVTFNVTAYNPANQVLGRNINAVAYAYTPQASYTAYTANGLNQYTAVFGATNAAQGYDANGNLTSDGVATTYSYDKENRLTSITTGGGTAQLTYDPKGRLVQVGSGASATHYLYDGDALVAMYDNSGLITDRFVHGPGVDEPLVWYSPGAINQSDRFYQFANHQGSIVAISKYDGSMSRTNTYDAYGVPDPANGGRFQYTGQLWLPQLGMYYYKARMYNQKLGRFMQTDPVGYTSDINLYAYVYNDPLDKTDPTGNVMDDFVGYGNDQANQFNRDSKEFATRTVVVPGLTVLGACMVATCATVGMSATAGGLVSGGAGAIKGEGPTEIATDVAHGVEGGSLTPVAAETAITGRLEQAILVGLTSGTTTSAQGGSSTEAVAGGLAAGLTELLRGNPEEAAAAGSATANLLKLGRSFLQGIGRKSAGAAAKAAAKRADKCNKSSSQPASDC